MPWKWIVCAQRTYTAARLTGYKSWLWMVHSVTVTQQRAFVLGHMCTEALTFTSTQALGGQFLPRRNKCGGRPISDTCVASHTYRNTPCWRWPQGKRWNGQSSEAVGRVSTNVKVCSLPLCGRHTWLRPKRGDVMSCVIAFVPTRRDSHPIWRRQRKWACFWKYWRYVAMLACGCSMR